MAKVLKTIIDVVFILTIVFLTAYFALRLMNKAIIYKVETGSMEDGIHAGDSILVYKKNSYKLGDVITYKKDNYYVTHRIIKKKGKSIITKGDANNTEDEAINMKNVVGKAIYSGGFLNFLIDYKFVIAAVLLALYLLSCYFGDDNKELKEEKLDNFLSEK